MRAMRASTTDNPVRPDAVFICAAGHSGSTLLDFLIGAHPAAMSLGEITQLPKNLALNTPCSCGARIRECPLWATVVDKLAAEPLFRHIRVDPYVLDLGLFEAGTVIDAKHQTAARRRWRRAVYAGAYARWRWGLLPLAPFSRPLLRGARNKWRLFDLLATLESRLLVVDSSKHYLEAAALYLAAPQRTRILLLVRDGRAVFYSGLKRGSDGLRHLPDGRIADIVVENSGESSEKSARCPMWVLWRLLPLIRWMAPRKPIRRTG